MYALSVCSRWFIPNSVVVFDLCAAWHSARAALEPSPVQLAIQPGLAVAGATVQATNTETGAVYTGASTAAGNYTVPNLPVGTYGLSVDGARLQDLHSHQPDHRGGANPEGRHPSASGRDHRVHNRRRPKLRCWTPKPAT